MAIFKVVKIAIIYFFLLFKRNREHFLKFLLVFDPDPLFRIMDHADAGRQINYGSGMLLKVERLRER